jgi:hypothetical protein
LPVPSKFPRQPEPRRAIDLPAVRKALVGV